MDLEVENQSFANFLFCFFFVFCVHIHNVRSLAKRAYNQMPISSDQEKKKNNQQKHVRSHHVKYRT